MCSRSQYFHCISKKNWVKSQSRICKVTGFFQVFVLYPMSRILGFQLPKTRGLLYGQINLFSLDELFSYLNFRHLLPLLTKIYTTTTFHKFPSLSQIKTERNPSVSLSRIGYRPSQMTKSSSGFQLLQEQFYNSMTGHGKDEASICNSYFFG